MEDIVFVGDWVKDRVLGSGSFGTVILWKHKRTDEKLAIKTCKWGDELTTKHKERWSKEVEMLENCRHPNIVGTKKLPPEFVSGLQRANPSGLPVLCMEYCSGGDLRQLLHKPESCGGLKEQQVRQILNDIRNAVQFLHQNRITHRDLKPENIVMHVVENPVNVNTQGKIIYKLIDLGYAKEIDSNSICASFVGTLQYLAPEILYSKTYSNSVDYWSLGLLAFEIICGKRPFLTFMAPVQWMPHVKKKSHSNICVYETFHGDIEYSDEIYPENHISKPLKLMLEEWLRIALEWDPKLRGRGASSKVTFNIPEEDKDSSNVVIFDQLQSILSKKIIKILSVATYNTIAYEITDNATVSMLKSWIQKETNIATDEQILISQVNYNVLNDDELLIKYWNENNEHMLCLFSKTQILAENAEPAVPKTIQRCLEHPKALYNFKNSQNLYYNGLYFVMTQMEMFDSLIKGLFIRAESLKFEGNQLLLKHNTTDKHIGSLLTQEEMIKKIVDVGKKHISELKENSNKNTIIKGFEKIFNNSNEIFEKICKLKIAWSQVTVRLQSSTRRCNESITNDLQNFITKYNFQTVYTNAYKSFLYYKTNINEFKGKDRQCHDIVKVCYDCLKIRTKILTEIRHQPFALKLMDLSTEFSKISDIIVSVSTHTDKLVVDIGKLLDELNNYTWSTISLVMKDPDNVPFMPMNKTQFKIGESVSNHCIKVVNKVEEDEKLKSLIEDSIKIRYNHINLTKKINKQKELINKSIFDFSFLNEQ